MSRFSVRGAALTVSGAAVATAVSFVVASLWGEQPLSLGEVLRPESPDALIFWSLRLPRVVLAGVVGGGLAVSGSVLQALLRNPLADPFVLGVSGGAAVGATVALAFGAGAWATVLGSAAVSMSALAGALGAMALVMTVARLAGGGSDTVLLVGVIFNAFALAATLFLKTLVAPDRLGEILYWLAGSLGHERWPTVAWVGAAVALGSVAMVSLAPSLNALAFGDDDATSLGVKVRLTRRLALLVTSLVVAAVVSVSGLVGFVGLLVPQLVRLVVGGDQRLAVACAPFAGASFLMLADLAARLSFRLFETEAPVGVVTALLGGPLFLLLMVRRRPSRVV